MENKLTLDSGLTYTEYGSVCRGSEVQELAIREIPWIGKFVRLVNYWRDSRSGG